MKHSLAFKHLLPVVAACIVCALALSACKTGSEHPSSEHPQKEHQTTTNAPPRSP